MVFGGANAGSNIYHFPWHRTCLSGTQIETTSRFEGRLNLVPIMLSIISNSLYVC